MTSFTAEDNKENGDEYGAESNDILASHWLTEDGESKEKSNHRLEAAYDAHSRHIEVIDATE